MSVIVRNSYGAIAVNKVVIERMIIEDMLSMSSVLMLSTNAVEVSEKKDQVTVKLYIVVKNGKNISNTTDKVFETVENIFEMLRLRKPAVINVKVRGIAGSMNGVIVKRNIDIVRNNK